MVVLWFLLIQSIIKLVLSDPMLPLIMLALCSPKETFYQRFGALTLFVMTLVSVTVPWFPCIESIWPAGCWLYSTRYSYKFRHKVYALDEFGCSMDFVLYDIKQNNDSLYRLLNEEKNQSHNEKTHMSPHFKIIRLNPWNIRRKVLSSRKYASYLQYLKLFPKIIMKIFS